jgi:hypothetical protein
MYTSIDVGSLRRRNTLTGWIVGVIVSLFVIGGGVYAVVLSNTTPLPPSLPASPPHSTVLARGSKTDILDGNFILTTALYQTKDSPVAVIRYYRGLLQKYPHQIGKFLQHSDTTLPARAPEALQHVPPIFANSTDQNSNSANYFYTEYSFGQSDVGIAVDARHPNGPTYVYQEMLTLPSS